MLQSWVARLQEREDALKTPSMKDRSAVFAQMIELVMLAEKLRNAEDLQDVMQRALRLALPQDLQQTATEMLKNVKKMDKGTVSRSHLMLDVGFMLHHRVCNWKCPDKVRYLMWDSSPQFGRDYQMALIQTIDKDDLPFMLESFQKLSALWKSDDEAGPDLNDKAAIEQDAKHMSDIQKTLQVHALPTVLIGFGVATFQHKLWALLHGARLEVFNDEGLRRWTDSLLTVASDYGVERRLVDASDVLAKDITCWFEDTSPQDIHSLASGPVGDGGDAPANAADFEDPVAAPLVVDLRDVDDDMSFELPESLRLSFEGLLGIPGLHHVIDNATKGLEDVMLKYKENIFLAQQVCKMLRKRDTKPKLLQRCFAHGQGPVLAQDINSFEGWVHTGRWHTVAFSIPHLLRVKHAMVTCYDQRLFLQGFSDEDESTKRGAVQLAEDVSTAVSDPAWWAWLSMLEVICSLLRKHVAQQKRFRLRSENSFLHVLCEVNEPQNFRVGSF